MVITDEELIMQLQHLSVIQCTFNNTMVNIIDDLLHQTYLINIKEKT